MPSLSIPEAGLPLGNARRAPSKPGLALQSAFALTLTDNVIEDMIKCFQSGKQIQLSLGDHPSLQYGTKTQNLATAEDSFQHELFRTTYPSDSESSDDDEMSQPKIVRVENKVNTQFLAMFGKAGLAMAKKNSSSTASKATAASTKSASATAGVDDALTSLKNSLATEKAKKDEKTINYVKDGSLGTPNGRRGPSKVTNKSKFMSQNRSMPASPALSGVASPSLGPTSVPLSQQQAEQAKASRKPVIHLLAIGPMAKSDLLDKIADEPSHDILQALEKVGVKTASGQWELNKKYFKELDVWTFDYDSQDDRQRAIDNAVKTYDKMRLAISEPEWDRLLPKMERGTGKILSKLQKDIAEGLGRGPKINVQRAEDSGRDTPLDVKGESTPRAGSQPPTSRPKKLTEKEAQAKRLLSSKPAKPVAPKAPAAKKEKKEPVPKATATKVLSSQFVNSSDDDDDFLSAPPVTKPKPQPLKRSREESETSDSSIPLSKKVKKDLPPKPESQSRPTNNYSSQSQSQSQSYSHQSRTKGTTSPQKSSPLASSPPTNASEFESSSSNSSGRVSPVQVSVRKTSASPIHKRHQKSSSVASSVSSTSSQRSLKPAVVDLARKYRSFYPKYASLHTEVANLKRRDRELEEKLLQMHERLRGMKAEILEGIIEVS